MSSAIPNKTMKMKLRVIFHCKNDFLRFLRWKTELNLPRENWRTDAVVVLRPLVVYRKKSKQQRDRVSSAKQYIHHLFFFESMEGLWIPRFPVNKTINFLSFQVEWLWTLLLCHFDYWYLITCHSCFPFFFFLLYWCLPNDVKCWYSISVRRSKKWNNPVIIYGQLG